MVDIILFSGALIILYYLCRTYARTETDYLLAGRKTTLLPLTATLVMTEFNTSTLISFSALGYLAGTRALLLPLIFLFGLTFYALTVAKKWKEFDGMSVAEVFKKRYTPGLAKFASISLLLAMIGFSATYVKSLALIFAPLLPCNLWITSALLLALTLLLTLRGGLLSIIKFDLIGFFLVLAVLPLIALFSYKNTFSFTISETLPILPTPFILSLIILTMFTYILAPWYGQKMFAAKTPRIAKSATALSALFVFILYGLAILATTFLKVSHPNISPELALPYIVKELLPPGLTAAAYLLFFTAAATTLAGVWSAMAAMIVADFLPPSPTSKRSTLITLSFAALSYLLANTLIDDIFQKMILANIPIAALSYTLLAAFFWKKTTPLSAYVSITVGLLFGTFSYLYFGEQGGYTIYWAFYGLPLIFLSGITTALLQSHFIYRQNIGIRS